MGAIRTEKQRETGPGGEDVEWKAVEREVLKKLSVVCPLFI